MKMRTNRVTTWGPRDATFEIPSGEPVEACLPKQAPEADRKGFLDSIKCYQKIHGREFTVIKIRDWYAIIDRAWLDHAEVVQPATAPKFGDKTRARVAAANARR